MADVFEGVRRDDFDIVEVGEHQSNKLLAIRKKRV